MPKLTRRGLLAVGGAGAAGLAVAGCGTEDDPRADGRDGEILERAASAEASLGAIYDGVDAGAEGNPALQQFRDASSARLDELNRLGASAADAADSEVTVAAAITAADPAIAAYREGAGFLSTTDMRATVTAFLAQVSSEQATLRGLEGDDQSPRAFVTGGKEEPYIATDDNEDTTTSSTTSSTTSTTSTSSSTTTDGE
jgi:hypothetical protein